MACTSKLCSWKSSRTRAEPAPLKYINFKRPKKDDTIPVVQNIETNKLKGFSVDASNEDKNDPILKSLYEVASDAAIFKSIDWGLQNFHESETDSGNETGENSLPEPLTSLYDPSLINDQEDNIRTIALERFNKYTKSLYQSQLDQLTKVTCTQSHSKIWNLHRAGRITASISKLAWSTNVAKPSKTFLDTIMQYKENISVPATRYGQKWESKARKCYQTLYSPQHVNFELSTTGIHVNAAFSFLGASPDGLIKCTCHGLGLLEIKCPYKFEKGLNGWKGAPGSPVTANGEIIQSHQYYFQIQQQMLVTDRNYCDFFVWTQGIELTDKFLIRIEKDEEFCQKLLKKLENVFVHVVLPELVCRKNDPENEKPELQYCICKRPSFNPMIACDNTECEIEWYHYSCVNIKRAPEGSWFCPQCKESSKNKVKHGSHSI